MGRTGGQKGELTVALRVVHDMIVLSGATPMVWTVLGTKPGTVTGFDMRPVEGEAFEGPGRWPAELFTTRMLVDRAGLVVPTEGLAVVDILAIWQGTQRFGTRKEGYYLWQAESTPRLVPLSLMQVRGALASPWLDRLRYPAAHEGRQIVLRS